MRQIEAALAQDAGRLPGEGREIVVLDVVDLVLVDSHLVVRRPAGLRRQPATIGLIRVPLQLDFCFAHGRRTRQRQLASRCVRDRARALGSARGRIEDSGNLEIALPHRRRGVSGRAEGVGRRVPPHARVSGIGLPVQVDELLPGDAVSAGCNGRIVGRSRPDRRDDVVQRRPARTGATLCASDFVTPKSDVPAATITAVVRASWRGAAATARGKAPMVTGPRSRPDGDFRRHRHVVRNGMGSLPAPADSRFD